MPDLFSVLGRNVLVTGGVLRIGRAISLALASHGAHVVIHYRTMTQEVDRLKGEVEKSGVKAWSIQADFDLPGEAESLFAKAVEAAGSIDILINNASAFPEDGLMDFSMESLASNINVNAFAPLLLARAFGNQGKPGVVINLLDARMGEYDRKHVSYSLSKQMLHSLTRLLALELAPEVRVNAVAPGLILPPPGKDEAYLEAMSSGIPLQRYGDPHDIVNAVLYLVESTFVTGQVLYVDGGRHLGDTAYGERMA